MADKKINISKQIAVYKTSKALLEFIDNMKPASINNYAKLHADGGEGETNNGYKSKSRIKVVIGNYEEKPASFAEFNLLPCEIKYILDCWRQQKVGEIINQTKIIGAAVDEQGNAPVKKIIVARYLEVKGTPQKLPWKLVIENGTGVPKQTGTGGTAMQSGTYKVDKKLQIPLSDYDMYKLLSQVCSYIDAWETMTACKLIKQATDLQKQ